MNVVQPVRHPAREDPDEPGRDHGEADGDAPDREPDEVRQGEEKPEEDRQPVPLEVVRDDEVDRMRRRCVGLEDGELLGHQGSLRRGPVPLRRR